MNVLFFMINFYGIWRYYFEVYLGILLFYLSEMFLVVFDYCRKEEKKDIKWNLKYIKYFNVKKRKYI